MIVVTMDTTTFSIEPKEKRLTHCEQTSQNILNLQTKHSLSYQITMAYFRS